MVHLPSKSNIDWILKIYFFKAVTQQSFFSLRANILALSYNSSGRDMWVALYCITLRGLPANEVLI
jgi:hypothetical protein